MPKRRLPSSGVIVPTSRSWIYSTGTNGTDTLIAIRGELPECAVEYMLSMSESDGEIERALRKPERQRTC